MVLNLSFYILPTNYMIHGNRYNADTFKFHRVYFIIVQMQLSYDHLIPFPESHIKIALCSSAIVLCPDHPTFTTVLVEEQIR